MLCPLPGANSAAPAGPAKAAPAIAYAIRDLLTIVSSCGHQLFVAVSEICLAIDAQDDEDGAPCNENAAIGRRNLTKFCRSKKVTSRNAGVRTQFAIALQGNPAVWPRGED